MALMLFFSILGIAICGAGAPARADGPSPQSSTPYDWSGFYLGTHTGGALGLADVANPYGSSIFGDTVRTPGSLAGGQAGVNWQHGAFVHGLEADATWADMDGTNTCFAYSGYYVSSNCRARLDALGTFAGRVGWALPWDGATLLFAKGGLAWAYGKTEAKPNGGMGLRGTDDSGFNVGWTVGAGAERAIARGWSLKAEYAFLSFDDDLTAPTSQFQTDPPGAPVSVVAPAATDVGLDVHEFKVGMNYHFGGDAADAPPLALPMFSATGGGTVIRAGVRYVYGWGQFHKDLGIPKQGLSSLASRLTYDNSGTSGVEAFARVDAPFNLMVKGLVGGADGGGRLNDEDWAIDFPNGNQVAYSNTISKVDDDIRYWMIDAGYDWWRRGGAVVAAFVGYGRFTQDMTGIGCRQIANRYSDCSPPLASNLRAIEEDDVWQALRLGGVADVPLAPRLMLSAEAAYLPYVHFTGTDNHLLRKIVSPEQGDGVGMQLEAMLSYAVTDALSLGVGRRYWSVWTTDGTVNFGGDGTIVPMRYASEQAHLLVEGSYKFDIAPSQ